jgi:hypothetical protein
MMMIVTVWKYVHGNNKTQKYIKSAYEIKQQWQWSQYHWPCCNACGSENPSLETKTSTADEHVMTSKTFKEQQAVLPAA